MPLFVNRLLHICSNPLKDTCLYSFHKQLWAHRRGDAWSCVEGQLFVHQAQRNAWDESWFVNFCKTGPVWLVDGFTKLLAALAFNRFVLWCVPTLEMRFLG
jgi:hypothetical protein